MELNQTTSEQSNVVADTTITSTPATTTKKKKQIKPIPKDFTEVREMNAQELNDAFFRVQKILSEVGNRALDFDNNHLFDTTVVVLKQMNLYTKYSKK